MAKRKREWPPVTDALPVGVVDNHTHLPLHPGEIPSPGGVRLSLAEQLARAEAAGVERMITSGCALPDFDGTLQLARTWKQVKVALAIHPNEAALHGGFFEASPDGYEHVAEAHHIPLTEALERLADDLGNPEVVAVGETGLDYFRTADPGREAQKESFRAHLELARQFGLPVQIHDRDAHEDTVRLLKESASPEQLIVFHCFSGDSALAAELAENGWFASFAGPLTYPANDELRQAFSAMPAELVLVETDAPYLTPVPYRGCPNGSYVMTHTVRFMSELWGKSLETTIEILNRNTDQVYGAW